MFPKHIFQQFQVLMAERRSVFAWCIEGAGCSNNRPCDLSRAESRCLSKASPRTPKQHTHTHMRRLFLVLEGRPAATSQGGSIGPPHIFLCHGPPAAEDVAALLAGGSAVNARAVGAAAHGPAAAPERLRGCALRSRLPTHRPVPAPDKSIARVRVETVGAIARMRWCPRDSCDHTWHFHLVGRDAEPVPSVDSVIAMILCELVQPLSMAEAPGDRARRTP